MRNAIEGLVFRAFARAMKQSRRARAQRQTVAVVEAETSTGGPAMIASAKCSAARVSVDQKGSTAVEFAIIAATAAAVLVTAFEPLFTRIITLLPTYIG